ncbi:MAG: hypothetical protein JNM00_13230, partial [Flavobacteriales bacterium]|nr:hypothetical protein [Flavobacteriales bacterium]
MFSFRSCVLAVCWLSICTSAMAQVITVSGKVTSGGIPVPFAGVFLKG